MGMDGVKAKALSCVCTLYSAACRTRVQAGRFMKLYVQSTELQTPNKENLTLTSNYSNDHR